MFLPTTIATALSLAATLSVAADVPLAPGTSAPSALVNTAPTAANDSFSTNLGVTLTVNAASGVLANDSDAENDTLLASIVTQPSHGTVTLQADGSFSYIPAAGYFGADSFTYKVNDGSLDSAPATVNLSVIRPLRLQGFGNPIEEASTGIVNVAKAGRIIPLKFRVTDANQNGVFLPELVVDGTLTSTTAAGAVTDEVEFYAAGESGLLYVGNGYYQVNWLTNREWANSMRLLTLSFDAAYNSFATTTSGDLQAKFSFRR